MLQKKFLLFTTGKYNIQRERKCGATYSLFSGSDRVPVGGMQEMTFKISKLKVKEDRICIIFFLTKSVWEKNLYNEEEMLQC